MKRFINEYKGVIFVLLTFFIAAIVLVAGVKQVENQIDIESYVMEQK